MKIKPIGSPSGGRCSDFSPFLPHPTRTHYVNPVPANSFLSGKCPMTSGKAATLAKFAQFAVMHPHPAGIPYLQLSPVQNEKGRPQADDLLQKS